MGLPYKLNRYSLLLYGLDVDNVLYTYVMLSYTFEMCLSYCFARLFVENYIIEHLQTQSSMTSEKYEKF